MCQTVKSGIEKELRLKKWLIGCAYSYKGLCLLSVHNRFHFCPFSAVPTPIFASKYSFFSIFQDLQSPLSGEKKCKHFSSPEKKNTFGGELRLGRPSRQRRPSRAPWGLPTPDLGSTLGQPSVNVRSTFGIFPSHLGPIFADFAGLVD